MGIHRRVLRQGGRLEEAEQSDRAALDCQEALVRQVPEATVYRVWLGEFSHSLADVLLLQDKPADAQQLLARAIPTLEVLRQQHPEMWYLHGLLSDMCGTWSQALRRSGQPEPATAAQKQASDHLRQLREQSPWPPAGPPPR